MTHFWNNLKLKICNYIGQLQALATQLDVDLTQHTDPDGDARKRKLCAAMTGNPCYRCRNSDLVNESENVCDFTTSETGWKALVIDELDYCFTLGELRDLATANRWELESLKHPFARVEMLPLRITYRDQTGRLVDSTYRRILPKLVKPRKLTVPEQDLPGLYRQLADELNYALDIEQSHANIFPQHLQRYSSDREVLFLWQFIFTGIFSTIEWFLIDNKTPALHSLVSVMQKYEKGAKTRKETFQALVTILSTYNWLYDVEVYDKFVLNRIKTVLLSHIQQDRIPPAVLVRAIGPPFFFPEMVTRGQQRQQGPERAQHRHRT